MYEVIMKYRYLMLLLPLLISGTERCYAELDTAGPVTEPVEFETLTTAQKNVLAPMREQWSQLPSNQQQRLIRGANRWANMSNTEQDKARAKMQRWLSMTPEKRETMLKRLERYQAMSHKQRRRLRQTFRKFRQLPESRRQELRKRWRNSGAAERRQIRREIMSRDNPNGGARSRLPEE